MSVTIVGFEAVFRRAGDLESIEGVHEVGETSSGVRTTRREDPVDLGDRRLNRGEPVGEPVQLGLVNSCMLHPRDTTARTALPDPG